MGGKRDAQGAAPGSNERKRFSGASRVLGKLGRALQSRLQSARRCASPPVDVDKPTVSASFAESLPAASRTSLNHLPTYRRVQSLTERVDDRAPRSDQARCPFPAPPRPAPRPPPAAVEQPPAPVADRPPPDWNALPGDLIQKVLSMMPACVPRATVRCVCRTWLLCIDSKTRHLQPRGRLAPAAPATWPARFPALLTLDLSNSSAPPAAQHALNALLADPAAFPALKALSLPLGWLPLTDRGHCADLLNTPLLHRLSALELRGGCTHPDPRAPDHDPAQAPLCLPTYSYRHLRSVPPARVKHLRITRANLASQASAADLVGALASAVPALPSLHLPANAIPLIPHSLSRLTCLHTLDLSHNRLTWWPAVLSSMPRLRSLSLAHNPLSAPPPDLSPLTALTALNLQSTGLAAPPPSLPSLPALHTLNLSHNPLSTPSIPPAILASPSLRHLSLRACALTKVTPAVTALAALTLLDLSHNKIASFDAPLTALPSLQHLDLSSNRLSRLRTTLPPEHPPPLPNHPYPDPYHPPHHTPAHHPHHHDPGPPSTWDVFAGTPASALTHLDLSSNRLESFPMVVLQLTHLETLLLDDQKGWQWYNSLPVGHHGGSIREEVHRRCPRLRTYTDA